MTRRDLLPSAKGPFGRAERRNILVQPRIAARVMVFSTFLVVALLLLAAQTQVPQVIRAPGAIIPEGSFVTIETMEGGLVDALHAADGERVAAGDVLIRLQNPSLSREHATLSQQIQSNDRILANANALLEVLQNPGAPTAANVEALWQAGLVSAASRVQLFIESQRIQADTITQNRATVAHMVEAVAFAENRVQRQQVLTDQQADLLERGITSRAAFTVEARHLDQLMSGSAEASLRLAEARNTLALNERERERERLMLLEEALSEQVTAQRRLAELSASAAVVAQRLEQLTLKAPFDGVVQTSDYTNVGAVIEPGAVLFELLPTDLDLVVEVRIPVADIGGVTVGQDVALSIDTFSVREFGRAKGEILSLAPASIVDPRTGDTYFRAQVRLEATVIGEGAFQRTLQAGMTAVAEISSGEQTLLAAFLGPVHRTMRAAFSENT